MHPVNVGKIKFGDRYPLVLIAGPCAIESESSCLEAAAKLKEITAGLGVPFIFKSSFDKANRLSVGSYRGPGLKKGLAILKKVKSKLTIPKQVIHTLLLQLHILSTSHSFIFPPLSDSVVATSRET